MLTIWLNEFTIRKLLSTRSTSSFPSFSSVQFGLLCNGKVSHQKINGANRFAPFRFNLVILVLERVDHVDKLAQTAVVTTIEPERDTRQIDIVMIFLFFWGRLDSMNLLAHNDIGEVFI